jgi:hypothetical protein
MSIKEFIKNILFNKFNKYQRIYMYINMDIPIIIICYNNYLYVKNTLEQILKINEEYYKNIKILNNKSTCLNTIIFLNNVNVQVINNFDNNGPWISPHNNNLMLKIK